MVEGAMCETIRRSTAVFASAVEDHRDRGLPDSLGRVHAKAVIWARTVEGKKAGAAGTRGIGEVGILPPSLAPFPDGPGTGSHLPGHRGVRPVRMFPGHHQDLRPEDSGIGGLAQPGDMAQAVQLLTGKGDGIRGSRSSWHRVAPSWWTVRSQYSAERLMAQKPLAN